MGAVPIDAVPENLLRHPVPVALIRRWQIRTPKALITSRAALADKLDRGESEASQIFKRRIVELGLAGRIIGISGRHDDHHTLAGPGE